MSNQADAPIHPTTLKTRRPKAGLQMVSCNQSSEDWEDADVVARGLTKREYAAFLAMQALISQGEYLQNGATMRRDLCADAVGYADALLAELEKTNGNK